MILSDVDLRKAIADGRIGIDPFDDSMIQPSSIDVRVDAMFRVFRNHTAGVIDVKQDMRELTEVVEIPADGVFMLHPGEFVLGSTLERITVPDDLVARVDGKSSLGRLGLLIHSTAGMVDPGFDGHITLELANVARLADHPLSQHEDRPAQLHDHDDTGGAAVRQGRPGVEVPGPARADAEPLLRELPRRRVRVRRPYPGATQDSVKSAKVAPSTDRRRTIG